MKKTPKTDSEKLLKLFKKKRKQIRRTIFLSAFLLFVAFALVGTKLFYPYHLVLGMGCYAGAFILFFYKIYAERKMFKQFKTYKFANNYYKKKKWHFLSGLSLFVLLLSFFAIRPINGNPFKNMTNVQIMEQVEQEISQATIFMDVLEVRGHALLSTLKNKTENADQQLEIKNNWNDFLEIVTATEELTDIHKYFDKIHKDDLAESRGKSFMISYSLYLKKYELIHQITQEVNGSEYQPKVLNDHVKLLGRNNIYQEMAARFYHPKTALRINLGQGYMKLKYNKKESSYGAPYLILQEKSKNSYLYLAKNVDQTVLNSFSVFVSNLEEKMFKTWFPLQRDIANTMGHIIISGRGHEKFITTPQIKTMQQKMEPGDIMLQRRNWYISNVGIPGFWTHSALYTGTLDNMNQYFASEFPYENAQNFTEYLKINFPEVFTEYKNKDTDGELRAVIEAIEPGIVLQSLETSAHADFVVVLRPHLTKKDKMLALFRTYENFGKPYDYNFDFDTRDALVCSELIYDAYRVQENKAGLTFLTSLVNGRKMVSPTDMANKFGKEYQTKNPELKFIYFLAGSEDKEKAFVSDEKTFLESLNWSKFSFNQ